MKEDKFTTNTINHFDKLSNGDIKITFIEGLRSLSPNNISPIVSSTVDGVEIHIISVKHNLRDKLIITGDKFTSILEAQKIAYDFCNKFYLKTSKILNV